MRALFLLLLLGGCTRTALRTEAAPVEPKCPSLDAVRPQLESSGWATVREPACRSGDRCTEGPVDCLCEGPHGGAPRPNWWQCHRARAKPDGCADDAVLLAGGACSSEGKQCRVPLRCGCDSIDVATCRNGRWEHSLCDDAPCLAP